PGAPLFPYTTLFRSGRLRRMRYPDGEEVTYRYDAGGLVESVTGDRPYLTDVRYDRFGQRLHMKQGNGMVSRYSYGAASRRLSRLDRKSTRLNSSHVK